MSDASHRRRPVVGLTREQMLMALEEMPPRTGYGSRLKNSDGSEAFLIVARDAGEHEPYFLVVVPLEATDATGVPYDTSIRLVRRVGSQAELRRYLDAAPLTYYGDLWLQDDTRATASFFRDYDEGPDATLVIDITDDDEGADLICDERDEG